MKPVPKVSIIVPMYNVERYLIACLETITAQTLHELEIILVNDGSPDRCGEIAERYAKEDQRITVIHKPNGGISTARNVGIRAASGEYIGFVDPDDWIRPQMFSKLYEAAIHSQADAAICAFYEWYEDSGQQIKVDYPFLKPAAEGETAVQEGVLLPLLSGQLHAFTWNKIYKTSILKSHDIQSPEDMPLMQDIVFNQNAVSYMSCVVYVDEPLYYFRRHSTSNTMKFRPDIFEALLRLMKEKELILDRLSLSQSSRLAVNEWFIRQTLKVIGMEYGKTNHLSYGERKTRIRRMMASEALQQALTFTSTGRNTFEDTLLYGIRTGNTTMVMIVSMIYNRLMSTGRSLKRSISVVKRSVTPQA
ncbi:hypothetical protein SY83_08180 [Paenibacillus swuensis]|uniref:Glycosyltransferase 2-like domain-containing protein n=1 Tax=Paenibacillus swuensis TaxID=1178515 RepID=A0A172THJ2_9BACL|nr:glycosyltransferase [Paenibacillus swuensis]ANE46253.1 hypothetical protein SY83_08180 [Paenibacillus swuensis]